MCVYVYISVLRADRPCLPLPSMSEHAPATQLFDAYTANTRDTVDKATGTC